MLGSLRCKRPGSRRLQTRPSVSGWVPASAYGGTGPSEQRFGLQAQAVPAPPLLRQLPDAVHASTARPHPAASGQPQLPAAPQHPLPRAAAECARTQRGFQKCSSALEPDQPQLSKAAALQAEDPPAIKPEKAF